MYIHTCATRLARLRRHCGMGAITATMACTDLDDPALLAAFALTVDGALFLNTYGQGTQTELVWSLGIQAGVAVVAASMISLGVNIGDMEVYAQLFKDEEARLHKEHTEFGPESFGIPPRQPGKENNLLLLMAGAANIANDFDTQVTGRFNRCLFGLAESPSSTFLPSFFLSLPSFFHPHHHLPPFIHGE